MYSQFTLFPRKSKRHCQIYYVRFRDSDTGERLTPTSSGKTNKSAATQWAIDQLRKGDITQKSKLSFREFTKNWFVWGKCPYISLMLSKGHSFSHSHADGRRRTLINHLLPYFLGMKLSAIDVNTIESFLANLGKKNYSPSTVNNAYYTLSIVLSEALRQGYIQSNPILKIKRIAPRAVEKGTIPLDLARKLFLADSINSIWNGNSFWFLFNQIAFTTGMRQGEICALRKVDVKDGYIEVNHTWDRKYGLKPPKYQSKRIITIPPLTTEWISKFLNREDRNADPCALLFHGKNSAFKAIDHKAINKHYYRALAIVGIPESRRLELNITFHSWRHTFNSLMRGNISDSKLRRLTGHRSEEMTEHYTHFNLEDFKDVIEIQKSLLE